RRVPRQHRVEPPAAGVARARAGHDDPAAADGGDRLGVLTGAGVACGVFRRRPVSPADPPARRPVDALLRLLPNRRRAAGLLLAAACAAACAALPAGAQTALVGSARDSATG